MAAQLEAEILAASQSLRVPGTGEQRVLTPMAVQRLAEASGAARWEVEAQALLTDVVPLHYLRNLSAYGTGGQARLLRSTVAVTGHPEVVERLLEMLAVHGVGTLRILTGSDSPAAQAACQAMTKAARNRNASCEFQLQPFTLSGGSPAEALRGADAVAACLDEAQEEQLLQFACRMVKAPLVLAGVEGFRGQVTTVLPGDGGSPLIYRAIHPHLEKSREGVTAEPRTCLMVGTWMSEQILRLLLDEGELLRNRLLYADMESGKMYEYRLQ